MFLEEWKTKPRNDYIILLGQKGDYSLYNPSSEYIFSYKTAENITNCEVCVYNIDSDRVSDKSVYVDTDGNYYITAKKNSDNKTTKMYLNAFKHITNE